MDLVRVVSRLVFAGLSGPELSAAECRAIEELEPGGVTLFARNLRSPSQTRDLVVGLRELAGSGLLVAVDLEGGPVNRFSALESRFEILPPAREQARWPDSRLRDVWHTVGRALASLGFDLDFAPVVDLDLAVESNGIGVRSFASDPAQVARCARLVLEGLADAGITGCLKHFPGLGGTEHDTHRILALSPLDGEDLWLRHLAPYRALSGSAEIVMTAHAHYPCVDGPDPLPGTFSRTLVTEWLRKRVGFEGVVISDDLEMGAVAAFGSPGQRVRRAFDAGVDVALFCRDLDTPRRARDEIATMLEGGAMDPEQIRRSHERLEALRQGSLAAPPEGRGSDAFMVAVTNLQALMS